MLKVISPHRLTADEDLVVRQAFAGLCWSKQFYCFDGSAQCTNGMSCVRQLQQRVILTCRYILSFIQHISKKSALSFPFIF